MDANVIATAIPIFAIAATLWNSSTYWGDGHDRTLYPNQYDDGGTQFTGEGKARIDGAGKLILTGDAPRYRVLEPTFDNVSVQVYALRESEEEDLPYQGITLAARSQHYDDMECGANTYYASITRNGDARFEKELFHGHGDNAFYPSQFSNNAPEVFDGDEIPKGVWIGLNFSIVTTSGSDVLLTLDVDKSDGEGFQRVLEFTDDGEWPVNANDVECEGFYPDNKIILAPGMTFIRNDGLGQYQYKDFVIRELNP